jgi:hypothetical protein
LEIVSELYRISLAITIVRWQRRNRWPADWPEFKG